MKIRIDEIRELCEGVLLKQGIQKDTASLIVDEYIEGELEGKLTHGLIAFPALVQDLTAPKEEWKVEKETDGTILINGNNNFGLIVGKEAVEIICKKARKEGMALAAIYNVRTFLRPETIAKMVVGKDMIGIILNNGGREMVVPEGGIDPVLATNPIGVGIPAQDKPIVFDMATSKRAWGEISVSKTYNKSLPEDTFLDKDGNYTTNPSEAYSVVPFGGYKGYALGLLVEILTGSLINMPMGVRGTREETNYRRLVRGCMIIAIDPSFFTDLEEFKKKNSELVEKIKSSRKAKGVKGIFVPGERARRELEENLQNGTIEVADSVIDRIKKL